MFKTNYAYDYQACKYQLLLNSINNYYEQSISNMKIYYSWADTQKPKLMGFYVFEISNSIFVAMPNQC